jgi:CheY-like chemotaxis protein
MSPATPRLLLVDDDTSLAAMLREFLELQGFSVDVLHNAEDGLARIDADPPDLLILDVMLPGMSGFEALKELRSRHDLPVVMLTARGEESERILGLMGGADDYLPKPFSPLELRRGSGPYSSARMASRLQPAPVKSSRPDHCTLICVAARCRPAIRPLPLQQPKCACSSS